MNKRFRRFGYKTTLIRTFVASTLKELHANVAIILIR